MNKQSFSRPDSAVPGEILHTPPDTKCQHWWRFMRPLLWSHRVLVLCQKHHSPYRLVAKKKILWDLPALVNLQAPNRGCKNPPGLALLPHLLNHKLDFSCWNSPRRTELQPYCLLTHLTACCMKRSGSTAEKVVRTVPVGTPSSSLISLWFVGKYGASLTSVTEMVTPAVDWKDIWIPLARGAWLDTITVSMNALFIS